MKTALVRQLAILALLCSIWLFSACRVKDYTNGKSNLCEVHHVPMIKTNVPIVYGLLRFDDWGNALMAARTNFPHADNWVGGGCIVSMPKEATIYLCPECLAARQKWETAHQDLK